MCLRRQVGVHCTLLSLRTLCDVNTHGLVAATGANLEAEDSDGDTAIHLVCIQLGRLQRTAQSASLMMLFMNVSSDVMPQEIDKAQQIYKVNRHIRRNCKSPWILIYLLQANVVVTVGI